MKNINIPTTKDEAAKFDSMLNCCTAALLNAMDEGKTVQQNLSDLETRGFVEWKQYRQLHDEIGEQMIACKDDYYAISRLQSAVRAKFFITNAFLRMSSADLNEYSGDALESVIGAIQRALAISAKQESDSLVVVRR